MTSEDRVRAPECASCPLPVPERACMYEEGRTSKGCPTAIAGETLAGANREYERPEVREFALQASRQEASCYANRDQQPYIMQPTKTRLVEICEFADRMSYRRLGLAFCVGLAKEAGVVEEVFRSRGFEVASALCKAGRTPKSELGLTVDETIFHNPAESMCNPIYQAELLNRSKTDFNVLLGLCVGHDSLFFKYSQAPVTVLAVKDRVTGHNPLAAVYLADSYYRKVRTPGL